MKADTRLAVIPLWLVVDTKVPSSAVRLYAAMAGLFGGHDRPDHVTRWRPCAAPRIDSQCPQMRNAK